MALCSLDASTGAIVALSGPWGIGKTSVLNMIAESLREEPALDVAQFNPWLFSGTEQLLADFFSDLASQLRLGSSKREKLADRLDSDGDTLALLKAVPVVGSWAALVGGGGKLAGRLVKPKAKDGLSAQHGRLRDALASLDRPIVVIIDDIDRLQPSEIGDILRLVRLTGSFPNLIYLLAFDRQRVEEVLTQQGFEGGPYLEKIVEYAYDVPAIPPTRLQRLLAGNHRHPHVAHRSSSPKGRDGLARSGPPQRPRATPPRIRGPFVTSGAIRHSAAAERRAVTGGGFAVAPGAPAAGEVAAHTLIPGSVSPTKW